jgi:hypothetical protein
VSGIHQNADYSQALSKRRIGTKQLEWRYTPIVAPMLASVVGWHGFAPWLNKKLASVLR